MYKGLMWDKKAKWTNVKAMWVRWYDLCQEKAILEQKAMYSWARTMALCALLCLVGVVLEAEKSIIRDAQDGLFSGLKAAGYLRHDGA